MNSNKAWAVWEDDVAERLGASKVRLSGRLQQFKGDVKSTDYLIDCKYTEHDGYAFTLSLWDKLSDWARNESRVPLAAIRTGDGHEFVILPMQEAYSAVGIDPPTQFPLHIKKSKYMKGIKFDVLNPIAFTIGGTYYLAAMSFDEFAKRVVGE